MRFFSEARVLPVFKFKVTLAFTGFCASLKRFSSGRTKITFAEEMANQEIEVNDNKAVVMVQKQPTQATSTQKQAVKNNWFCIVIQVNGKIQETNKGD